MGILLFSIIILCNLRPISYVFWGINKPNFTCLVQLYRLISFVSAFLGHVQKLNIELYQLISIYIYYNALHFLTTFCLSVSGVLVANKYFSKKEMFLW